MYTGTFTLFSCGETIATVIFPVKIGKVVSCVNKKKYILGWEIVTGTVVE